MENYQNELIKESSPYLLQHANNPVNWVAWSDEIYDQAKRENKLILISIGYSACHWCHVMESECFEDVEVATLMNKFFINVKVDREERPDVDQVYMSAVQLMTNKGGWPLNCFTLPDGRPVYGGTYFPKEQWMHILKSLNHTYENDFEKMQEYATNLHKGVQQTELVTKKEVVDTFEEQKLEELIVRWSKSFDSNNGGETRAPKFPLPSNYEFLLDYALNTNNEKVSSHVKNSLLKMANGGIYDQVGGGFSRYSVDMLWKVPHFEKMLYDNGQLLTLYSKAYSVYKIPRFKEVVFQTIQWLSSEMHDKSGAFYSAIDADSEGVEGKFYVWKKEELKELLGDDYSWVSEYYSINQKGLWEEGNYILLKSIIDAEFASSKKWSLDELKTAVNRVNSTLLSERNRRVKPGLDDKCLTSWNAMTLKGLCNAYAVFGEEEFLLMALKNAKWITSHQIRENGFLFRNFKNGNATIDGFLEDYAHTIDGFISMFEITGDSQWLNLANSLEKRADELFFDETSGMYFFTDTKSKLIARKMEINDNVIPSSNSVMARNLFMLGKINRNKKMVARAEQMLKNVYDGMEMYGSGYSNWAILLNHQIFSFYEFVCVGPSSKKMALELFRTGIPKSLIVYGTKSNIDLPVFKDKQSDKDLIYVCVEGTCFQPVTNVEAACKLLFNN